MPVGGGASVEFRSKLFLPHLQSTPWPATVASAHGAQPKACSIRLRAQTPRLGRCGGGRPFVPVLEMFRKSFCPENIEERGWGSGGFAQD